jgi:hypothetical protein
MNNTVLLQKLIAIERSIGTADNGTLRQLVYEAEDCLLQIQKERAQSFILDSGRGAIPQFHSMPRFHLTGEI